MKRTLCICMCAVMLLGFVIPFTASAATLINQVSFTLAQPEAGKIPPGTATWHGQGYSVYSIDWYDRTDGRFLEVNEKIQADHQYKATLWVMAMDGYEFACKDDRTPSITAYINGEACETVKAYEYNAWAMVCVNYYFSAVPAKGWISSVNLTVSAPVAGQKPGYSQITGSGYATGNVSFGDKTNENMKNGIAWYTADWNFLKPESDSFAEKTAYVFHCLLFPEDGYRFKPDCAVYVNGKQADVSLDYDLFLSVSFQFPATGTIPSSHTHTPSPWRTTGIYHYTVCTVCGDMLDQEDHKGGVATCAQKGKCTVCGYEYIDVNENHTPDTSKWVARGDMYHYHPCKLCGAHADMEDHRWSPTYLYQDEKGHAWICADCKATSAIEKHNPGAEATETTPQTCKDCGYIITPAKNHTHTLTKVDAVEATCLKDGNIAYYTCDGCSDWFRDEEGKARFTDRKDVLVSAIGHKDENQDGKCDVCGFVEDIPVPTESQPVTETPVKTEPTAPQTDGNQQTMSGWLLPVLIGVPCFAGALIAMILVLKGKGKKMKKILSILFVVLLILSVLPVSAAPSAPEITLQPQNYHYPEYSTAMYTVKASGQNLSATWYLKWEGKTYNISDISNGIEPWEAYAGESYGAQKTDANTFICFFGGIEDELNGAEIWCVIEDGHNDVTSARAIITVQGSKSPPEILSIPAKVTVSQGKSVDIRCVAKSNSEAQLQYTWYETTTGKLQDIRAMMPEENSDFLVCNTQQTGTRYYVCGITASNGGMVYSSVVPVTVVAAASEPTITTKTLPDATVGESYYVKLACTDPDASFGISYNPGKSNDFEKTGLNLTQHGEIEGTPTKAGTYGFAVCAAGEGGEAYETYTLTVKEAEVTEPEQTELPTEPEQTAATTPVEEETVPTVKNEEVTEEPSATEIVTTPNTNGGNMDPGLIVLAACILLSIPAIVVIIVVVCSRKKKAKEE